MTTGAPSEEYCTLADLLGYWERGELTLKEILERWPHPEMQRDQLIRDLLRVLAIQQSRLAVLEGQVLGCWPGRGDKATG